MTVRIAVIGLGECGVRLLECLRNLPDAEVVIGCDTSARRLERVMRKFPDIKEFTTDWETVVQRPDVDAVAVATPTNVHSIVVKRALLRDKDVFVERPLADSSARAGELVKLAEERARILMVGHLHLYDPAVRMVKEMIEKRELGDIYYITSSWILPDHERGDSDVIWELAVDDFAISLFWIDKDPNYVNVLGANLGAGTKPDVAFLHVAFPGGIIADFQVSFWGHERMHKLLIAARDGFVLCDPCATREKFRIVINEACYSTPETIGKVELPPKKGEILPPNIEKVDPIRLELQHFLECILYRKEPLTNGAYGLRVIRALEQAEKSFRKTWRRLAGAS